MRRFLLLLVLVLSLGPVMAQELTTGLLEGTITAEDGTPIKDAIVTLQGPQGIRTQVTDDAGRFTFRNLSPATYTVKAEAPGYGTIVQSDVEVFIGRRVQLPFTLLAGKVEEVRVSSRAPIVDLKSTGTGEAIKVDDFAPYVPLGRSLVSTFSIAPGVTDGGTIGAQNQSISGASGLENAYFVDGVNITNSGYGALGAYSIVYGSLGTGVTYDFLEEVQVKTGGFEAEFGQAGGGVVNSVVKTGTNTFTLDAAWYEEPAAFEANWNDRLDSPNWANRTETTRRDIALSVGGPILKDKLFYFVAYNPVWTEAEFRLTSGDATVLYDLDGDGVEESTVPVGGHVSGGRIPGSVTRERQIDNYAGKLTYYFTPNQKFEVMAFGDPSEGDVGPQNPVQDLRNFADNNVVDPFEARTGLDWGGDQFAFKHQGVWTSNFFTEFQYSYKENNFTEFGPGTALRSFLNEVTAATFGGAGFYEDQLDEHTQWKLHFTNVFGPVEIKYGYQYEDIDYAQPRQYSGPTYTEYFPRLVDDVDIDTDGDGVADTTGTGLLGTGSLASSYTTLQSTTGAAVDITSGGLYNVTRTGFDPLGESTNAKESNAFVQATWDVLPNLTVKAGFRWTEQELTGAGEFTLPISENFSGEGSSSFVPKTYTFDSEIAPRVGLSWDVVSNGRHKLFANYGEYYQRVPSDLAIRQFSNEVGVEGSLFDDANLSTPNLDSDCVIDSNGDGIYETTVLCHSISGTGAHPGIILDGTQLTPGSDVYEFLGSDIDNVTGAASKLPYTEEFLAGYAWQVNDWTALEVRYITREIGRVLEDVQFASNEQIWNLFWGESGGEITIGDPFPGHGVGSFGAYVLANVGTNVSPALFPNPVRDYKAWEFTFNRRFHDGWMMYANYRYARLNGNYEGSYRNDNGQSDPFITSLFDLPAASAVDTNDDGSIDTYIPSATLAGQYVPGPLNTDRAHIINAFVSKQLEMGLNLGGRLTVQSGQPRFPLFAHPTYRNAGEIPGANPSYWSLARIDTNEDGATDNYGVYIYDDPTMPYSTIVGDTFSGVDLAGDTITGEIVGSSFRTGPRLHSYDPVKRDFFGRNPTTITFDVSASYDWNFDSKSKLTFKLDIFNLFNENDALTFDNNVELRPGSPNPDYLKANLYNAPRFVRLGVIYTF